MDDPYSLYGILIAYHNTHYKSGVLEKLDPFLIKNGKSSILISSNVLIRTTI
jgi:hypothetical protein